MSHLDIMKERRAAKQTDLDAILDAVQKRDAKDQEFTEAEQRSFDELVAGLEADDKRIAELTKIEERSAAAAKANLETGNVGQQRGDRPPTTVTDPDVYARGGKNGNSYFRDLGRAQLDLPGGRESHDRLQRYAKGRADEQRALGNTNTTGGSGGEFAPPDWLIEDFVAFVRPGMATAQLYSHMSIPPGVSSVNLPKVLSGTSVALQSTQNTTLSQTDLTTGSVGTGFSTIGGTEVVSQQLLDQSEIDFDQVITADLAAAWALTKGTQVLLGTGTGANNNSVINGLLSATPLAANTTTWTQATPGAAGFFGQCGKMLSNFATARFAQPTVWLMHPRRWYWLLAQSDTQGRPLVTPDVQTAQGTIYATNPLARNMGDPAGVVGAVGMFLGLPVVIDPLLPTNLGAGTNQDEVFLLKSDDLWIMESDPVAEVFRQPFAQSMGVLYRMYSYVGTILNRQLGSIATLNGTGLVTPAFPS